MSHHRKMTYGNPLHRDGGDAGGGTGWITSGSEWVALQMKVGGSRREETKKSWLQGGSAGRQVKGMLLEELKRGGGTRGGEACEGWRGEEDGEARKVG